MKRLKQVDKKTTYQHKDPEKQKTHISSQHEKVMQPSEVVDIEEIPENFTKT